MVVEGSVVWVGFVSGWWFNKLDGGLVSWVGSLGVVGWVGWWFCWLWVLVWMGFVQWFLVVV